MINLNVRPLVLIMGLFLIGACSPNINEPSRSINLIIPTENVKPLWFPSQGLSLQIQFSGEPDLEIEADVFDLDAFDTDPSLIQQLHQYGKHAICYINAGAIEDWRPDVSSFPPEVVGKPYQGWPGENWLDIRNLEALAPILEARLDLCKSKGFDGVEYDNMDGFQNDTGFKLTDSDQLAFNRWLAEAAHERGLAAGLKNDPDQIVDIEPWFDFLILESCYAQGWCDLAQPFVEAGKPVFAIEYSNINKYCAIANNNSITLLQKKLELDAWRKTCP
jgi:hypothetical protein